ncbi:MAG: hypothetical protein AAGK14_08820 [Verrucomicrobiota bacterium]
MSHLPHAAGCGALLAAWLVSLLPATAGTSIPVNYDPALGISIRMERSYESMPPYGYLPVRVEIENKTAFPRRWNFSFKNSRLVSHLHRNELTSSHQLSVPEKSKRVFNLLVPLAPRSATHSSLNRLGYRATGYGLTNDGQLDFISTATPTDRTRYFLLGDAYASPHWTQINTIINGGSMELDGSRVAPGDLPEDWRGYLGCSLVMLSEQEWRSLGKAQQLALTYWVAQGGTFGLIGPESSSSLGPLMGRPAEWEQKLKKRKSLPIGFGKVVRLADDGSIAKRICDLIKQPTQAIPKVNEARNLYIGDWGLADTLPGIAANQGLMLIFVVVFAVIVGPLNLFFFASKQNRYRLFWTTPLISIGASLLLCVAILIFDGLGGIGKRMVVGVVLPGENSLMLLQEQISRTAVLTSGVFEPGENTDFEQIIFAADPSSGYAPISQLNSSGTISSVYSASQAQRGQLNFYQDPPWYSGDYFQSRAVQAQSVTALQSSRNRLEMLSTENGAPRVVSSFAQRLQRVFYRDGDGKLWKLEELDPGARVAMEPAEEEEFSTFWSDQIDLAGGDLSTRLREIQSRRHYFFAQAAEGSSGPVLESLASVRWETMPVLYVGCLTPATQPEAAP